MPRARAAALAAIAAVLVVSLYAGGADDDTLLVWPGGAALVVLALTLAAAAAGLLPLASPSRAGLALLAATGGIAAWSGASIGWSIAPDLSWGDLNRGLVYVALLALGAVAGSAGPRACRLAATGLALLLAVALLWALAGKAVPALFPDGARAPRLRNPVGYWNALALAATATLVLGTWLASRPGHPRLHRVVGAVLTYAAAVAIPLTGSRTGLAMGALALAAWLALGHDRLESAVVIAVTAVPGALVGALALTRPGIGDAGASHSQRVADGVLFALVVVGVGAGVVVVAAALASRSASEAHRRLLGRGLATAGALLAAALVVVLLVAAGSPRGWVSDFTGAGGAQVANDPGRLGSFNSNNRWRWWNEAWDTFADEPVHGTGARTFSLARKRIRENALEVSEPHSLPLQALSDTGVVGLALLAAAIAAGAATAVGARRRLQGGERAAAAALALLPASWVVFALVDYTRDFVAVGAPAFVALGVLMTAGRPTARPQRLPLLVAAALALAATASLASPWLSDRSLDRVGAALERRDVPAALAAADRAESFDPFSPAPLIARARAYEVGGRRGEAQRAYADGVRRQPDNAETWYLLGEFELDVQHDACNGYTHLNRAYTLDRYGPAGEAGGALDRARAVVDSGRCAG